MIKEKYTEIGEYFRLAILLYSTKQKRGFQKKISEVLETEKTYISDFFNGKRMISEEFRAELADYLGFKYEELISIGKKISNKSVTLGSEFRTRAYNEDFPKNVREEKGIKVSDLAFLLDISEAEYIFKEKNLLAFTNKELVKLTNYISLTENDRKEYLKQIWREHYDAPAQYIDKKETAETIEVSGGNRRVKEEQAFKRMMAEYEKVMKGLSGLFKDLWEKK